MESSGETLCEMFKGDVAVGLVVFYGACGGCLWMERSADRDDAVHLAAGGRSRLLNKMRMNTH